MPELDFHIEGVEVVPYAASPMLAFKLRVNQVPHAGEPLASIHSVILRCQVRLEPARRRYAQAEQEGLNDLFGEPQRWGQTVKSMLWTNAAVSVPAFTDQTLLDLPIPCTWDFSIAATKYFDGLADGEIPLCLMFSGNVFYADETGALRVAPISWDKETRFRLPLKIWKDMMAAYYPNSAWLCLRKDVFDRLYRYKMERGIPTWEEAIESALASSEAVVGP